MAGKSAKQHYLPYVGIIQIRYGQSSISSLSACFCKLPFIFAYSITVF